MQLPILVLYKGAIYPSWLLYNEGR